MASLPAPPPYQYDADSSSDQQRPPLPDHPPRSSVPQKHRPVPPVPPLSPTPSIDIASDCEQQQQPLSHGTSDEYVEKQLVNVMDGLNIKLEARGAVFEMTKPQKLSMIQQYNRRQQRAQSSQSSSCNHIQLAPPVLAKHISSPMLSASPTSSASLSAQSTIPLHEAQRKLQRCLTPEHDMKVKPQKRSTLPPPNPLQLARSAPLHGKQKSLPPPVPASIKQKYLREQQEEQEHTLQRVDCNSSDDDEEYEYYDEDDDIEPQPAPITQSTTKEEKEETKKEKPKEKAKVSMKVKLRVGSEVQVFSASRNGWLDGVIVKIKKNLICVKYGGGTKKWLEANSKNFRPKLPGMTTTTTKDKIDDDDVASAKQSQRVRNSIAFKQKKAVKVKLKIGSEVEVFSASQNKWVLGTLNAIKKDVIRIAYGPGLNTQKWLRADSKQFRPRLHKVEQALQLNAAGDKDDEKYEIVRDDGPGQSSQPPVQLQLGPMSTYLTHHMRREQYVAQSAEVIMGRNNKRGDLKIKVNGALQLRHDANYATLKVAEHTLKTKRQSANQNPVWKEILTFSNFRPHIGKTAVISVYNKGLMGEKCVGSAEFELPIVFGSAEKMTIDLADAKNKLSGIIVLEQAVVEIGR